jgi:hypothetical protein
MITWAYDDGNGNKTFQHQLATIRDKTPPVPTVESLPDISGECLVRISKHPTAIDECDGTVIGVTKDPTEYSSPGTYTITWIYHDSKGNESRQKQNVTVRKNSEKFAPLLDPLPTVVSECSAIVIDIPKAAKNCGGVISATTKDPLSYTDQGNYTITWIYNDEDGNSLTQLQKVIVKDSRVPVPNIKSLPDIIGECSITVSTTPTAKDNCSGSITATTNDPIKFDKPGVYTITWLYRDGNGNGYTQDQKVIIKNSSVGLKPMKEKLPDIVGECSATVIDMPKALGSCGAVVHGTTTNPLKYNRQGVHTITWLYDDGNGNMLQQTQRVIIDDTKPPVPDIAILADIIGDCSVTVGTIPTAKDNCSGTITATTKDPIKYNKPGVYTITWMYRDDNGNGYTQSQRVTVKNSQIGLKPMKEKLPDIVGECSATVIDIPNALGSCGAVIQGATTNPLKYNRQGVHTITWNYKDSNGNTLQQAQKVIIKDTRPPVPDIKELPDMVAECSANIESVPSATDNCDGLIKGTTSDALRYSKPGMYKVRWTYEDANKNIATQEQKIIVKESSGKLVPLVSSLPDITSECAVTVTEKPRASKNCGTMYTGSTSDPLTYTSPGTYTITWIYHDESGRTLEQTQRVIINDRTKPVPTVEQLPDLVGECGVTVTTKPTAIDNCVGLITGFTNDPLQYTAKGRYVIRWTFQDKNGNISEQVQSVIVKSASGAITPSVASLPDIINEGSAIIQTRPRASKPGGNIITATTEEPLVYKVQGTYIIRWIYKDEAGNELVQTQQVIIEDKQPPVPSVKNLPDISGDCVATITSVPTATDKCGGTIKGVSTDPLSYNRKGTHIVKWKYNDANGNSTIQQQRVIIKNGSGVSTNPSALPVIEANCRAVVTKRPIIKTGCGQTITGTTKDPLSYERAGNYTINWTYRISESQSLTQTQQVIVKDDIPPVPLIDSLPEIIAFCSLRITAIPRAVDGCGGIIKATTADTLQYSTPGEYTVIWVYEDGNGNSTTQTQQVILKTQPIEMSIAPNPTHNYFSIQVRLCNLDQKATLWVYDLLGRLLETKEIKPFETLKIGSDYPQAPYFILVTQGNERTIKKVFKLR